MISFWAHLTGSDIESYARSLILPDFMSHLVMEPFDFGIQDHNGSGRTPILIRYSAQGRREDIRLAPENHAETFVKRLTNRIDLDKIAFSKEGVLWNWTRPINAAEKAETEIDPSDSARNDVSSESEPDRSSLRIFFQPKKATFGQKSSRPIPPADAYVSVSRGEIFMAHHVLKDYIVARYRQILLNPDGEIPEPVIDYSAGTYHFQFGAVCGSLIPDDREVEGDLVLFADLKRPLDHVAPYLARFPSASGARFDSDGVRIRLEIKETPLPFDL